MRLHGCCSVPLLLLLGTALPLVSAKNAAAAGSPKSADVEVTATLAPPSLVTVKPTPAPTPAMIRNLPPVMLTDKPKPAMEKIPEAVVSIRTNEDNNMPLAMDDEAASLPQMDKANNDAAAPMKESTVSTAAADMAGVMPGKPMHVAGFITRNGDIYEVAGKNAIGIIEGRQADETVAEPNVCNYGNIVIYSDVPCDEVTNVQVSGSQSTTQKETAQGAPQNSDAAQSSAAVEPAAAASTIAAAENTAAADGSDPDAELQHEIDLLDELDEIDRRRRRRHRRRQQQQLQQQQENQRKGNRRRGQQSARRRQQQGAGNGQQKRRRQQMQRRRQQQQQQRPNRRRSPQQQQRRQQQRPNRRRVTQQTQRRRQQQQPQRRRQQQQWASDEDYTATRSL